MVFLVLFFHTHPLFQWDSTQRSRRSALVVVLQKFQSHPSNATSNNWSEKCAEKWPMHIIVKCACLLLLLLFNVMASYSRGQVMHSDKKSEQKLRKHTQKRYNFGLTESLSQLRSFPSANFVRFHANSSITHYRTLLVSFTLFVGHTHSHSIHFRIRLHDLHD